MDVLIAFIIGLVMGLYLGEIIFFILIFAKEE